MLLALEVAVVVGRAFWVGDSFRQYLRGFVDYFGSVAPEVVVVVFEMLSGACVGGEDAGAGATSTIINATDAPRAFMGMLVISSRFDL